MVNTHITWWRRWAARVTVGSVPEHSAPEQSQLSVDQDAVRQALRALAPRQRAVLVLRYYEDMTEAQIAEALRCRPGTVKSQAARGLATLRSLLEQPTGPVEELTR
jgi:RNA polymerase sigma factor (sigma-70 family)